MASSIKDRIAALNIEQVHAPSPTSRPAYSYEEATHTKKKPPPPPPPSQRPPTAQRTQTVNNPPLYNAPTSTRQLGNQPAPVQPDVPKKSPALPPRPPPRNTPNVPNTPKLPPSLPPRQHSQAGSLRRSTSKDSIATTSSSISRLSLESSKTTTSNATSNGGRIYTVRAPEYDPTKLPPLPARRNTEETSKQNSSIQKAMRSTTNVTGPKALPPSLPSRPSLPTRPGSKVNHTAEHDQAEKPRRLPPPNLPSALNLGFNNKPSAPPTIPTNRPSPDAPTDSGAPPPIPLSSRPNLDAIMASKPKPGAVPASCLICRDFSGPDNHAAQFPRTSLPTSDVTWLATQLTAPFPSATDKARAIFVWLHHNVDYDCHSFFSGNITKSTPERTISSGLAVCEGYAGLFAALALKAGLEAIVVGGHGKGFGHSALKPGDTLPPFKGNHAWNAVRIDHGQWKLMDACWGAGSLGCGTNQYNRHFTASEFTRSNEDFGATHYPENKAHLFRGDGRDFTWEDYVTDDMGGRVQIFGDPEGDHGLNRRSFQPAMKHVKVHDAQDPVLRIQYAVSCPHWDHERNGKGKPYVMTLNIGGRDGRNSQHIPFNTDGKMYWIDVNRIDLGAPGQKINVCAITSFDKKDGRGLTVEQYKAKKGKVASAWTTVACWELV